MEDPGLIVMPTHRLFPGLPKLTSKELAEKLSPCFRLETVGSGVNDALKVWEQIEQEQRQDAIGLYTSKDGCWSLTTLTAEGKAKMDEIAQDHHPEWRELGVSLLHRLIVETLLDVPEPPKPTYVHLVEEVMSELRSGDYPLAALVMPATVGHIKTLSLLGDRMPAKSTYFYPKLIAGFVFKPLEYPEQKPLKPGKWFGIIALLCALGPVISLAYNFCVMPNMACCANPWTEIQNVLYLGSLPCTLAGLVFGVLGHKTEGWLYAGIGRFVCLLYGTLLFMEIYRICY
jgi:hypothetical protein